jgi:short-subunit dehydrogenase
MAISNLTGKTALVTGASSGLGVDFATELARRGANLVLVARRRDRLAQLASVLEKDHDVSVRVMAMDLAEPEAPRRLFHQATAGGGRVDVLINNAGFGIYGRFTDIPWEREAAMLQLDIVALVHLTKLFVGPMVERGEGAVLQVASIGGYQPSPGYATYAAAKAFVLNFGEAINHELRGTGVSCTVVSPGVTATEFLQVAGQEKGWFHRMTMMDSPTVARIGIEAMLAGKPSVVTGWMNKMSTFSQRLMPRKVATAVSAMVMKTD